MDVKNQLTAQQLLDITVCLSNTIHDNDIAQARDLLIKISRDGHLQEVCMADATKKQKWLENIPNTIPNYNHYQYITSSAQGEVLLLEAIKKHRTNIIALMVGNGLDVNAIDTEKEGWPMTPLEVTVKWKNHKAAMLLLKYGADPKKKNCLLQTPLTAAILTSQKEFVKLLLNATRGSEIKEKDTFGNVPLMQLLVRRLKEDDPDILRYLLYYGANINFRDPQTGLCPLHLAIHYYSGTPTLKVIQCLLDRKADPNAKTPNGKTTLHLICSPLPSKYAQKKMSLRKKCMITELLLQRGANPNEHDQNFNSPLHLAAKHDLPKVAELLLDYHANLLKRNVDGIKPLDLAPSNSAVRRVLEEAFDALSPFSSAICTPIATPIQERAFSPYSAFLGSSQISQKTDANHNWNDLENSMNIFENKLCDLVQSVDSHLHTCSLHQDPEDGSFHTNDIHPDATKSVLLEFDRMKILVKNVKPDHFVSATAPTLRRHKRTISETSISSTMSVSHSRSADDFLLYKAFNAVATYIGHDWKYLFRDLDPCVDPLHTETLIQELESQYPGQLKEQAYQSTLRWKSLRGRDATLVGLKKALRDCSLEGALHAMEDKLAEIMSEP